MGTHEGGNNVHRVAVVEILNDLQCLQLMFGCKPVSTFCLHCGSTKAHHFIQCLGSLLGQLLLGCLSGGVGGGLNATACILNFQIGFAVEFHTQLILTPATKNQVSVGIHQTGCDQFPLCIYHFTGNSRGFPSANFGNQPIFNQHPSIF